MKELKTLWYVCNGCETSILIRDVPIGTLPEGWSYEITKPLGVLDGYGYIPDLSTDLARTLHYCPACTDKNEIKEVFA